jgi:hypothetical protein
MPLAALLAQLTVAEGTLFAALDAAETRGRDGACAAPRAAAR